MKIVTENTENLCIKDIDSLSKDIFGYKAILIKFSVLQNKKVDLLRSAIDAMREVFRDHSDIRLFVFKDYDILAVYQGSTISVLDSVYEKIKILTSEDPIKLTNIFDLEKNSSIVKNICNKKLELIELEKRAAQTSVAEASEAPKEGDLMKMQLDSKLLNTLSERKKNNFQTKILLIEDDVFSRRLVKNVLSKEFEVVEADSGKDALLKYVSQAPNIVFLDINLPDCNGMELLEKLISIDKRSYVVMLSGNSFKDNIVLSIQKGAKGFVGKPFPKDKIFHYIEKYKEEKRIS